MPRVLVVEDNEDILNLVRTHLKRNGYEVVGARSGHEALEAVSQKGCPDVLVLDVGLPDTDGLTLLTQLRERHGEGMHPVFLSARVQPDDVAKGRALGARYLTKPFVASALLSAVRSALAEDE